MMVYRKNEISGKVESAIARGMKTREQIQRSTHLDYDTLGEILVELVWEAKRVKIERVGDRRLFSVAA